MKVIVKQAGKPAEIVEVDYKYRNEVGKLISDDKITNEYVHIKVNELAMVVDEDDVTAVNKILDGATQMKLRKEYARIYGK